MTNKEAKEILFDMLSNSILIEPTKQNKAIIMAIKALEQEPILDKIRAEIEKQEKWLLQAGYNTYNVDIALDAIKSVLAESEVNNGK